MTRSLDTDKIAEIQAKPVLREGAIRTLYISDGREPVDSWVQPYNRLS